MGRNFWKVVNEVMEKGDVLLEVLDARLIDQTRNIEVEQKIKRKGKSLIYVINKSDLVSKDYLENLTKKRQDLYPVVFVSSKKHLGSKKLRDLIMREGKETLKKHPMVRVGVLGYPNTGKSSVINMLKGKKSAPTSSYSGFTKGIQEIKVTKKITLFDSPGVIPFLEKDESKHALISSKNVQQIKDPEGVFEDLVKLLETIGFDLAAKYEVPKNNDPIELLEEIALKRRKLLKKGEPDTERMAREIIAEWQKGKIR